MAQTLEGRIAIARNHFEQKGYRVHSGLQFGCELVLYADSPGRVHSDFCVVVVGPAVKRANSEYEIHCMFSMIIAEERFDWRRIQTLVRSMPNLHKTLIVANVRPVVRQECRIAGLSDYTGSRMKDTTPANSCDFSSYNVEELAIASEHAPFRHKNTPRGVGQQIKPSKI
ncbi:hypothetical protein HJC23_008991 [Cyclotella cryptica]|uniref:tRNA-intron lyase n=1 Tax=Cyclotella cryptica TaxID=29204 RepID=A0ABD3QXU6_9STRA